MCASQSKTGKDLVTPMVSPFGSGVPQMSCPTGPAHIIHPEVCVAPGGSGAGSTPVAAESRGLSEKEGAPATGEDRVAGGEQERAEGGGDRTGESKGHHPATVPGQASPQAGHQHGTARQALEPTLGPGLGA